MNATDRQSDERMRSSYGYEDSHIENAPRGAQIVFGGSPWLVILAVVMGALGFVFGAIAFLNSNKVADFAFIAGEAKSKAESATARANVSEIYAKQVYTELNRLGYPVKTPAEDHAPQPSDNVSKEPGK